ncbi:uncharacterized protein PAC_12793 [Phialocephala subalpina]|uniref:Uncharacterized protein n=1 Tax=Phialocephala subalpina TaxID=576137 RepID=A0A1L7XD27_9HELO|nr:uncharacterized protein PAC_12793 [Phialocephala subalpina]
MGLSRSRTITLLVAIATLSSNTLSSVLFAQLPDDPFHLANNFGWYLHFANILSVFGFIGALRQHALSIAIFANYLILDTILCSIPRLLSLTLLNTFSDTLCSSPSSNPFSTYSSTSQQPSPGLPTQAPPSKYKYNSITDNWSEAGCVRVIELAQLTLAAGVIAATVLQFVGALAVREYAKALWVKECKEEERSVMLSVEAIMERGMANEERQRVLDEERRRREANLEEWGFGGLPVIEEERELVEKS